VDEADFEEVLRFRSRFHSEVPKRGNEGRSALQIFREWVSVRHIRNLRISIEQLRLRIHGQSETPALSSQSWAAADEAPGVISQARLQRVRRRVLNYARQANSPTVSPEPKGQLG
jgi:hypothetical protein